MKHDPLAELWNSGPNRPEADAGVRLAEEFVTRWRRRRRWQAVWLTWTFLALTVVTAWAVTGMAKTDFGSLASQWTLLPMLGLPWLVALRLLFGFWREGSFRSGAALPLAQAIFVARRANEVERRRLALIGALLVIMTPLVGLAIRQLHHVGKATVDQAWSMALVFGVALMAGGGLVLVRLRASVLPEKRRLDALHRELDTTFRTVE